jgi:formate-dependent nitrite reductase membrane component NrfD
MKPYEWMVKYTQQTEWIEGQGVFIVIAFFLGGISGGLYLSSLVFNNLSGMFISWLLALLMGGFYLLHLGHPLRFWRMLFRPQTSWISRGLIFVTLFIGFVFIQLCFSYWMPGNMWEDIFKVLAGMMAFAQSIYTGFAVSYVNGIRFWNSALVPILFFTCGLTGGFAVLLAVILSGDQAEISTIENVIRILLVIYTIMILVYLSNATYIAPVAKRSVMSFIHGKNTPVFWGGVVTLGIIIPMAISIFTYFAVSASVALLTTAVACEIVGGFSLRYCVLKGGLYEPDL